MSTCDAPAICMPMPSWCSDLIVGWVERLLRGWTNSMRVFWLSFAGWWLVTILDHTVDDKVLHLLIRSSKSHSLQCCIYLTWLAKFVEFAIWGGYYPHSKNPVKQRNSGLDKSVPLHLSSNEATKCWLGRRRQVSSDSICSMHGERDIIFRGFCIASPRCHSVRFGGGPDPLFLISLIYFIPLHHSFKEVFPSSLCLHDLTSKF